jgi:hypothetical protein
MPSNLVFMGLHFVIGKCKCLTFDQRAFVDDSASVYANSLLAT